MIQEGHIRAYIFVCNHKPSRRRKKGNLFSNRILVEKWGKLTETGKKLCIWPVLSSCYLGFSLLPLFFQLLFLYLTLAWTTEHSIAANASRLTLKKLLQAAYWAGCAALHAPTLERSASPGTGHNTSSKMVAHRTPWHETEDVHSHATCLAWHGSCPYMTLTKQTNCVIVLSKIKIFWRVKPALQDASHLTQILCFRGGTNFSSGNSFHSMGLCDY